MLAQRFERRQFQRFRLQPMYTPVRVQRIRQGKLCEVHGHAYDISEAGLRIDLDERLEPGERVNISLTLPGRSSDDDEPICAAAVVVWGNDELDDPVMPRMGLQFTKYLREDSHTKLMEFLGSGMARCAA